MRSAVVLAVFPIIFLGELPDKTMFASLVLSSRGRPNSVWLGAAAAFSVHVAVAVTIGVGLFSLLPQRAVEAVVAGLFLLGAAFAFKESAKKEEEMIEREEASHRRVAVTAFVVIFLAESGDLTQILTANLAAHYRSPLSVGLGALLALWGVAAVAVVGGQSLMRFVKVAALRKFTGVVLLVLALLSAVSAVRG